MAGESAKSLVVGGVSKQIGKFLSSIPRKRKYLLKKNVCESMEGSSSSTTHEDIFYDAQETFPIKNKNTLLRNLKVKLKKIIEGKSSTQLKHLYCAICMESKPIKKMFKVGNCSHSFCKNCIGRYIAAKIQENISMINCPEPNCKGILQAYHCISIISKDVLGRWEKIFCENSVLESQKIYCPFRDCSAMLVNDGNKVVTVSECPYCHRLFCVQCRVPWHAGVDCKKFQNLKDYERRREDLLVMKLAKKKNWKRCPKCNYYVEKVHGCTRITCRCGHQFCYGCGSTWNGESHYRCATR